MKKLVLTLAIVLLAFNFSFANNVKPKKDVVKKTADGIEVAVLKGDTQNNSDDFAVKCKIKCDNGNVYTCWFCNCSDLPSCGGGSQQQ